MTPRQRDVYEYIKKYKAEKGCDPSFREIASGLEIKSVSNVAWLIDKLKQQGAIKTVAGMKRHFEL